MDFVWTANNQHIIIRASFDTFKSVLLATLKQIFKFSPSKDNLLCYYTHPNYFMFISNDLTTANIEP